MSGGRARRQRGALRVRERLGPIYGMSAFEDTLDYVPGPLGWIPVGGTATPEAVAEPVYVL